MLFIYAIVAMTVVAVYGMLEIRKKRHERERVECIVKKNSAILDLERKYGLVFEMCGEYFSSKDVEELHIVAAFIGEMKQPTDDSVTGCSVIIARCSEHMNVLERILRRAYGDEPSRSAVSPSGTLVSY